jgi:hypothetical protein
VIKALSKAVSSLTEEVQSIKASQSKSPNEISQSTQYSRIVSLLEPEAGYYRRFRNVLEDMNEKQYKNFHISYSTNNYYFFSLNIINLF